MLFSTRSAIASLSFLKGFFREENYIKTTQIKSNFPCNIWVFWHTRDQPPCCVACNVWHACDQVRWMSDMWSVLDWCLTLSAYPILMVAMDSMSHINTWHVSHKCLPFSVCPTVVPAISDISHISVWCFWHSPHWCLTFWYVPHWYQTLLVCHTLVSVIVGQSKNVRHLCGIYQ